MAECSPISDLESSSDSNMNKFKELDGSLISKMSNLKLTSFDNSETFDSPPKLSSTLIATDDHPLKCQEKDNYPDLIPKTSIENKPAKINDNIETLYFSAISNNSRSNLSEWSESRLEDSQKSRILTFDLPLEMSSNISTIKSVQVPDSPDVLSSSSQDRSSYQAHLDPYSGNVIMKHSPALNHSGSFRRKVVAIRDDDDTSSEASLGDEEPAPEELPSSPSDKKQTIRIISRDSQSETSDPIPEYSAAEEYRDERAWLNVPLPNGGHAVCDMKVIEPFKRVLSHGGYDKGTAIIVISGCYLPDGARPDYKYVMDNLFLYMMWTVNRLVTDEYILVYLHGSDGSRMLPSVHYLRESHKLVDRRLRKNLKRLYLVHPTKIIRAIVYLARLFLSSKIIRKLHFVNGLSELQDLLPVELNAIPDLVKEYDSFKNK